MNTRQQKKNKGFTLLAAIVTTSLLLIVSFVVVNVAFKQLALSFSNEESQYAFFAAESGIECALYWDLNGDTSQFATSTAGSITCNGQLIETGQSVPTTPSQSSLVGGGGSANPTSIFSVALTRGCAIVRVTKEDDGGTKIDSRGYNNCTVGAKRKVERGVELSY